MTTVEKLQLIKRLSGLTQEQLAAKLGVSFVSFNRWITGKAQPRKKAEENIDQLLQEYSGEKEVALDVLTTKKKALVTMSRKQQSVLKQIIARPDLWDQFMLELTYHSNRIEGSTLSEDETAAILFEDAILPDKTLIEQLEVKNHQAALTYLFDYLTKKKPINERFVLNLHAKLMNGIRNDAGSYRRHAVRIVGANVPTANYLKVPQLMVGLLKDIRTGRKDIISHVSKVHARFEQIHPFSDGNGRTGRLLMQAMLLKKNFAPAVINQDDKRAYLRYLNQAQTKKKFSALEDFICDAVLSGFDLL